ncbi:MAG: zinc ribbon domain-containing protein [Saccharofermentans sp.]|nr:zinc ribbon domain-containing protein [Saccharofermentans sp.]
MGLIKCPDCGNMVSDRAAACPSCGCPADAIKESLQEADNPDEKELIWMHLLFRVMRCIDRQDLIIANECVLKDLEQRLDLSYPVTFVGKDNIEDQVVKIQNREFAFPYVFVTANCRYTDHLKFTLTRDDGFTYQRYYDIKTLPANYTPVIEVFSDDRKQLEEITEHITGLMKEHKKYSAPFLGGNGNLAFSNQIRQKDDVSVLIDGTDTKLFYRTILLSESPWAVLIDEGINNNPNPAMKIFRDMQLAQVYLLYALQKNECDRQTSLYEWLFNPASMMKEASGPDKNVEYIELRKLVSTNQMIDSKLVDKAFNKISVFYHDLPNDIVHRVPVTEVKQKVNDIMSQYEAEWNSICDSYKLPSEISIPDYGWTSMSNNMRSVEGLSFLVESLNENPYRSLESIIDEYAQMLYEANEHGRMEAAEWEAELQERRRARSGFIGDVMKIAAGVAIGNKISDKRNKDK